MDKKDIIFLCLGSIVFYWGALNFTSKLNFFSSLEFKLILFLLVFATCTLSILFSLLIKRKFPWLSQLIKHLVVGGIALIVDLKVFEWLSSLLFLSQARLVNKGGSFLVALVLKYVGNKYWAFEKEGEKGIGKEFVLFCIVTFFGILIDIGVFFYLTEIITPIFGISLEMWVKLSVIVAALVAAFWNFLSYKYLIFKK